MQSSKLSRRSFLRWTALTGAAAFVAACQPQAPTKPAETADPAGQPTAGAAEPTAAASLKGNLTVWTYPAGDNDAVDVYEPLTAKFNEDYPDIKVSVDVQSWNGRREKLYAAAAAGQPPDIWWADSDTLITYAAKGVALPLNEAFTDEMLEDIGERNVEMGTYKGELLIIANRIHCNGPAHNGKLMAECGFDAKQGISTWDELLAVAETAKSKGYYADQINTYEWQHWLFWLRQAGGQVYSDDGTKVTLREQPCVDTLAMWAKLFQEGYVPKEGAVSTAEAANALPDYYTEQKQVTRGFSDSNDCYLVPEAIDGFQHEVSQPRRRDDSHALHSGQAAMRGWSVAKLSKQQDAAIEWVKWNTTPEGIGLFCSLTQEVPTGPKSMELWEAEPCAIEFVKTHEPHAVFNADNYTLWQESKVVCAPHFQAAVLGVETVEQAIEESAKELEVLLEESLQSQG